MVKLLKIDSSLPLWVRGDTNAFSGLGVNVLVNVLTLTSLCIFVVHLSPDDVYGSILPALGIALVLGNVYYTFLARRLARREGRTDVTAMPYGPSVPHMFIVVFIIMLPIYLSHRRRPAGLAGRRRLGVHHRCRRHHRGLRRPGHPPVRAPRGHARDAGRHLGHLHLDAAGRPDVGPGLGRPAGVRAAADRPAHRHQAAVQLPDRAGRAAGRHRHRLDRWADVGTRRGRGGQGHRGRDPDLPSRHAHRRPVQHRPAAGHGHPAGGLQLHRGHVQRGERGGRR